MKKTFSRLVLFIAVSFCSLSAFSQNYIDFGYTVDSYCEPSQITFYNYSNITVYSGPISLKWFIDSTLVSVDQVPLAVPIGKGNHKIRLEVYDSLSFLGTTSYFIDIYARVTDFFTSTGTVVCPGQIIQFHSDVNVMSAYWDFGSKNYFTPSTSTSTQPSYTYDKPGSYTVTYIVTNTCGTDTILKTITVDTASNPLLTINDIDVKPACPKDPVSFSTFTDYSSYLWEFGDGFTSTLPRPNHTYNTSIPAVYAAKLTVTNICGGTASLNFPVNLVAGLPADANFNNQPIYGNDLCPGTPIKFNGFGTGSYSWDFGDGTTSNVKNPVHQFSQNNSYPVTLTVTNACLNTASVTNMVSIYSGISYIPSPFFIFDTHTDDATGQRDTLYICPGQVARFINQTYGDPGISYFWDFGDGKSFYGYNAFHLYPDTGTFMVTLKATNLCGSYQTSIKYVKVDNGTLPAVSLMFLPNSVCPGEKVYFFDDNFDLRNKYSYYVDFGDGTSAVNIQDNTNLTIKTLATHTYASTGPFNFLFTATNFCGNTVTSNGTITVDNSATRKPAYFLENSTEDKNNQDPADWSVRHDPSDYQVSIPVSWASWIPPYGNDFYVFLWYGMFDPISGTTGKPNGFVHFNTASIVAGTSINAYIPVSQYNPPTVGIAAGYYCGGVARFNEQPEAFGGVTQLGLPVPSLPIIPSGLTDLASLSMGIIIDTIWDGVCNAAKIENTWFKLVEPGVYAQLSLYDTGAGFGYDMQYTDAIVDYKKSNLIESGTYIKTSKSDTITFLSYYGCMNAGNYTIFKPSDNEIQFTPINESCVDRLPFLTGIFTKTPQNQVNQLAVCPGDKVQFKIVGGASYQWNFGDGNTSILQFPVHAYVAPGLYNAKVIATNSCGRKDTLITKVTIQAKPAENVFFWAPEYEKFVGDSVHFKYEDFSFRGIDNNTYLWNFGDGKTSILKNPAHLFDSPGDYNVSLTVTNGCGPSNHMEMVTIHPKMRFCEAQFDFSWDGNPGYFYDVSIGNPTSWSWDFGDGTYSTVKNPVHNFPKDGTYTVTLTISNLQTNCISSITKKVIAAWLPCKSDFNTIVNSATGVTNFTSISTNATSIYWDFGDGNWSTDPNPVHTYDKIGFYPVCLTIQDSINGCQDINCKDIMVMPTDSAYIVADFSFFNDPADSTVYFYDLSSSNSTNWYWTTGDGKMLETQNPTYKYSKPGIYKVCLIATDNFNSLSGTICKEVRVGEITCAVGSDFTYFINPVSREVGFFNLASGAVDNYFWTFGDGTSSTFGNPRHQYLKPGYYDVTLVVRNSTDNCMDKFSQVIQIGSVDCRAEFEYRVNPSDNSVKFKDNSKGLIQYYYWDFGDGSFSVEQNPVQVYQNAGNYMVGQFVIDNFNNCVDYTIKPVQVGNIECSADFMSYIDSASYTAYFTNRKLGVSTALLWTFGDGSYSTQDNPVHVFPGEGLYSAGLNTYNFNNGCMDYFSEVLLIGGLGIDCQADFVYRVDPTSGEVTFSNKSIGDIVESVWSFGDDADAIVTNPVHTYTVGGYYNVCLTVTNSAGIRNTGCKWVLIEGNPTDNCLANFMFTVDSLNLSANFVNKSFGDINKYTWNFGDGSPDSASSDPNPGHIFGQKGYYLVQLKVENTISGCVSNEYKLLNIADNQVLKASFGYEAKLPDKKFTGYPVDLVSASSGDGATVEWDFGDKQLKKGSGFTVMDSTRRVVTHYYLLPGKYEVCVRISDPVRNISDIYCKYVSTKNAVNVDEIRDEGLNLSVYPNPFIDHTSINYSLQKPDLIEISVYDQLGRKVETLVKTKQDPGNYQITWGTKKVTTGIYHLKMITKEGIITRQLVITK